LAPPFTHSACAACPEGAWSDYTLSVYGASGQFAASNGIFDLSYIGNCTWESTTDFQLPFNPIGQRTRWRLQFQAAPYYWQILLYDAGGAYQDWYGPGAGWDCLSAVRPQIVQWPNQPAGYPQFVTLNTGVPGVNLVGTIVWYGGQVLPSNYLVCDGSAVSRNLWPELYSAIGVAFGPGDGTNTFNLPNSSAWPAIGPARYLIVAKP
jgi:hypothetical protein